MKFHMIPCLATFVITASASAASFDIEGFGSCLNGWQKDRTATYAFTDTKYRTHGPTVTYTPSGTMFLSTQVDLLSSAGKGAICQIGLTFSASGVLEGAQIKGMVGNKALDTGFVRGPEAPAVMETPAKGAAATPPRQINATDELIVELFTQFDAQMKKVTEAKETMRSDLFSRISGNHVKSADLSAALRHNVNLILQQVRG